MNSMNGCGLVFPRIMCNWSRLVSSMSSNQYVCGMHIVLASANIIDRVFLSMMIKAKWPENIFFNQNEYCLKTQTQKQK